MIGLILALGAVVAVLIYGLLAWERIMRRRRETEPGSSWAASARARDARPATEPDAPRAFGRDACWIAVTTTDAQAVVRALALRTVLPANWASGLREAAQAGVFVSPPIRGVVFVVGRDLLGNADLEDVLVPRLCRLSEQFGRAAWFCADADHDVFGWAHAERGTLLRGFASADPDGPVLWRGEVTEAERALDCFVDDPRDTSDDEVKWWPDRRIVHALAAAWSLDPDRVTELAHTAGVGWVGRL